MKKRSAWKLVSSSGEVLPPMVYSNNKTQEDVVNEALDAIEDYDIVFLVGGVGTGKSAIALHIIDYYGKGIISTPTKILEKQYQDDYSRPRSMRICNEDDSNLDINILMGRTNFECVNPPKKTNKPVHSGNRRLPCIRRL